LKKDDKGLMTGNARFNQFVCVVEKYFDSVVEQGTDHELFISGYLSGHFSLVVSQAEQQHEFILAALDRRMQASLSAAFEDQELIQQDQKDVLQLWHRLFASTSTTLD
jgi:hypothetical protein